MMFYWIGLKLRNIFHPVKKYQTVKKHQNYFLTQLKKELQFNCSLTIVSITRVIWPQNYSFFSSNNCSFSSIKNAVLLLPLIENFDKKRFGQDRTYNSGVGNLSR